MGDDRSVEDTKVVLFEAEEGIFMLELLSC